MADRDPAWDDGRAMTDAAPPSPSAPGRLDGAPGRLADRLGADLVGRPTRRRAGVFRRALRREAVRLRDPHRLAAIAILVVVFGVVAAGLIARGESAGADARAYWAGVRIWLAGGDPYDPSGPFMPYVYPPWMLPLFAPWALLPWHVAWFVWRGGSIVLFLVTVGWAYRRRPLATAVLVALLAFPIAANLDTGNVNLTLVLMLWAAQFSGPVASGSLWAISAWMKWVPAPFWLILAPRARGWGLAFLAVSLVLSLVMLPATIDQLRAIFGFGPRPLRLDYLIFIWVLVPWWWRHADPLWWARPAAWPAHRARLAELAATWSGRLRASPRTAIRTAAGDLRIGFRRLVGLEG
jgi:hypothetical protein